MPSHKEKYPFFFEQNETLRKFFLEHGELTHYKKRAIIAEHGKVCKQFFYLEKGLVSFNHINEDNDAKSIAFHLDELGPFFTCYDSYFCDLKTIYQIKAIENCTIYVLDKATIDYHLAQDANLMHSFHRELHYELLRELFSKSRLTNYSTLENLRFIQDYFSLLFLRIPIIYLAQFARISREWASKTRRKLRGKP